MEDSENYDDYDFPPAKYPAREIFTFCLIAGLVLMFVGWVVWKLISII